MCKFVVPLLLGIIEVEVEVGDYYGRVRLVLSLNFFNNYRTTNIINKFLIMYLCGIITKGHFSYS
jgi:hypothetical protein